MMGVNDEKDDKRERFEVHVRLPRRLWRELRRRARNSGPRTLNQQIVIAIERGLQETP